MLETDLRQMFEQQASADQPPAQISVPAVRQRALAVRRWRLTAAVGSPILAASAVLAVAMAGAIQPDSHSTAAVRGNSPAPTRSATGYVSLRRAAPREFNSLVPYASFGWLPAGQPEVTGGSELSAMFLEADFSGSTFTWTAYVAGACKLDGQHLKCPGAFETDAGRITSRAPDVDGHAAYWAYVPLPPPGLVNRILAYQYARGGWATLQFVGLKHQSDALKIADNVKIGQRVHLRFADQLLGEPGWRVAIDSFAEARGGPFATIVDYTPHAVSAHQRPDGIATYPLWITAAPAGPVNGSCSTAKFLESTIGGKTINLGTATLRMINGYKVYVNVRAANACADDADGLYTQVSADFQAPAVNVVTIFAHHLRLLGPDPAHWTTRPIAP